MYLINKLPELLSLVGAVILSYFGYKFNYDLKEFSFKLIVVILGLYYFGYLIRNTTLSFLMNVLRQNEKKAKLIRKYQEENNRASATATAMFNSNDDEEDDEEFEPYSPNKM